MQEDILEKVVEGNIYSQKTIVLSSFFGGIFAGSYMLYKNFKTLGDDAKARLTIIISILAFTFIIATAFVPVLEKIPGFFYTIFFTMLTSFLTKKFQGDSLNKFLNAGGKTYSTGNAVAICIINILILGAIILGGYYFQDLALKN